MSGRKILHSLQPAANNQQMLVGGNGFIRLSKKNNVDGKVNENANDLKDRLTTNIAKKQQSRSVKNVNQENMKPAFSTKQPTDDNIKTKPADRVEARVEETNRKEENSDSEVISWMTSDVAPDGYWKKIAEERRLALAETLNENKDLHEKIERLQKSLEVYKKENSKLQKSLDEVLDEVTELITSQKDDSGFIHD